MTTTDTARTRATTHPTASTASDGRESDPRPRATVPALVTVAALSFVSILLALLAADRTVGSGMEGMISTHYMGLLGIRQPWNLLIFMAIPVILAETLAITELALLFSSRTPSWVRTLSRWAGLIAGPIMVGIALHLLIHAVVPLTSNGGWRGPADVIAVLAYLAGAIPLVGITLVELGVIGATGYAARKWHAIFVGAFLVVAHIAMIFGMMDPTVVGWSPASGTPTHEMVPQAPQMPPMHGGH